MEVTNDGTLFYIPAKQKAANGVGGVHEGLARSFDGGRTWDAFQVQEFPESDKYPLVASVDHNLYVDHQTGRLFAYFDNPMGFPTLTAAVGGATIAFSDNDGMTWVIGNDIDHTSSENPTLLTGEPTVTDRSQMAYENVVYLCGDNTSTGIGGAGTPGFSCAKSVDGGVNWKGTTKDGQGFYSGVVKDNTDPYPECAGGASSAGAGVQPLPDGTLIVLVTCNGKTFVSQSADEGSHWAIVHRGDAAWAVPNNGSLRIDSEGNMFIVRLATVNGKPELLLSHAAETRKPSNASWTWDDWTPELDITAPGITAIGKWFFVQGTHADGQVGHLAVSYLATRADTAYPSSSDGFITETRDALDSNPTFWSAQVNSPLRPLMYNTSTESTGPFSTNALDFIGGALSPDGLSAWGSFQQSCGQNLVADAECQRRWPQTWPGNPTDGFAGRLVWPGRGTR